MGARVRRRLASAAALAAALSSLLACSAGTDGTASRVGHGASAHPTAALPPVEVETGLVHVHGLGVDPADGVLYAATHSGLFRVTGDGTAVRVANRAQDTMGFSVVGPGRFLGSGHPDPREDDVRPPLLGLVESEDAGRTWKRLSLHGQADFHALRAAHGAVYGFDATSGTFMVSQDAQEWDRRSRLPMRDFVVDPADADRVVATTEDGPQVSRNGGRSWARAAGAPPLAVLAWGATSGLFGVAVDGTVHRSPDAGASWEPTGSSGGPPEAVTLSERGDRPSLYVAVPGGIVVSTDGGRSFTPRYTGATR